MGSGRIRVGVIGLGTIGRRLVSAVTSQPDMVVSGIGVRRITPFALASRRVGHVLFHTAKCGDAIETHDGDDYAGGLDDLLATSDVIADARQAGLGATFIPRYRRSAIAAVFQGGEKASDVDCTFNSFVNYEAASRHSAIRITSCNTTGLTRVLTTLHREFGVDRCDGVLVRCSTDPDKGNNGLVNGAAPTLHESHHGRDLREIAPELRVYTQAVAVPMSFSHVQALTIQFKRRVTAAAIIELLENTPRIRVGDHTYGTTTGDLANYFAYTAEPRQSRGDRIEVFIWRESVAAEGSVVKLITSVDMQAITIADTVDCIRRMKFPKLARSECLLETDRNLGIAKQPELYRHVGVERAN
jgi:glyceraldehyde-3-phosphate dehydrogenase (NAD(P))